ncbi:MAG: hypothetical protein AB8B57_10340 [Congregibacter sp.]
MTYQDMLNEILLVREATRRTLIRDHWRDAFSDGFIAYVQSQIDATEAYVGGQRQGLSAWLPDAVQDAFVAGNKVYLGQLVTVWESMKFVYTQLATASTQEGNPTGIAAQSKANGAMPRGVQVGLSTVCARCGAASEGGLCSGCVDHDAFVELTQQDCENTLDDQAYYSAQADNYQADISYYDTQVDFQQH